MTWDKGVDGVDRRERTPGLAEAAIRGTGVPRDGAPYGARSGRDPSERAGAGLGAVLPGTGHGGGGGVLAFEGFALESCDGLVFTVKGHVHPPGHTVAYLRYAPDPDGSRRRDGARYRRLYAFGEQLEELARHGGEYLVDDPVFGVRLQAVPHGRVRRVHDPRTRLSELRWHGPRDPVEEAALGMCEVVTRESGVPHGSIGVTGSLLFGLHQSASDVDLVVYGAEAARAVHDAVARLLQDPASPVRLPDASELAALAAAHRADTPLSAEDFVRLQVRKVNETRFAGRSVFLRFVKLPWETGERYGDPRYEAAGSATLRARVADDADALFSPCAYRVESVGALLGDVPPGLDAIVSFRGRFAEQARTGEWVEARGTVERVVRTDGTVGARLTVGGAPGDYLLSLPG